MATQTRHYDKTNLPQRMWVNQPSKLQTYHQWHGQQVLAVHDYDNIMRVYFLSGPVVSMQMGRIALSPGWPREEGE